MSKADGKSVAVPLSASTTPFRLRAFSTKPKDPSKPDTANNGPPSALPSPKSRAKHTSRDTQNNNCQNTRRFLVPSKHKSGEYVVGSVKSRELDDVKVVGRSRIRLVSEQFGRPRRQRLSDPNYSKGRLNEGDLAGKNNVSELQEKLEQSENLIKSLRSEVLELKAELDKVRGLNVELQSQNQKLSDDFAASEAKIAALTAGNESSKFKDAQKLIANRLEHSKFRKEAVNEEVTARTPSSAVCLVPKSTDAERKAPECPAGPPPPPPLPPRPRARATTSGNASVVVELYHSLTKQDRNKDHSVRGNCNKPAISSAHSSIVGEFQNRSAHLLAIKSDIGMKGEFINGLIEKVLAAAYTDIEDVLKFVDWLDNELSSLVDERAVLKHFKWPEKKADAMREAAVEYRNLKLLENEVSSYKDDSSIPCEVALKKMADLLDRSEKSMQRLIKLRNSVMLSYHDLKIPSAWMLDSGIVSKIKQATMALAKMYMKRVALELESIRYSERESIQEALLLQGVHFAYRAHRFAGGLDSETLCALEEIRQRVPEHVQGSREILAGISSS